MNIHKTDFIRDRIKNSGFYFLFKTIISSFKGIKINNKIRKPDLLFLWIPKTAGKAIFHELNIKLGMQKRKNQEEYLSFPNKGCVTFGHIYLLNLLHLGIISKNYFDSAYKFAFIRNPYDRAISLYNYLRMTKHIGEINFDKFLDMVYLKRPQIGMYNHLTLSQTNPQVDWILDHNGEFLVDELFKIEEIPKFKDRIYKKYNADLNIIKKNESIKYISSQNILKDTAIIEKIEHIYARDFDILGFKKKSIKK